MSIGQRGNLVWPDGDVVSHDIIAGEAAGISRILDLVHGRRVAVQAGGHAGIYPRALAPHFEAVYAFEPVRELFECLVMNAPDVHCFNAALGDRPGGISMDLRHYPRNAGAAFVCGHGWTRCMTLDSLRLEACDLIMLDVEGSEGLALKGAAETIARFCPVIVVELRGHGKRYGAWCSDEGVREWLCEANYGCELILGHDEVWMWA